MQGVLDGSASGSPAALGTSPRTKLKRDAVLPNNQWVPLSSRHKKSKEEEVKRDEQLQAYTAWVNSQLKKRPGSRVVESLPRDMNDGVALIQLIEVVAGENLKLDENPTNQNAMKENVDRVLQFMAARRIRMHHTTSKDVVEGNLKAIMRLILALAAHFKPGSVRQSSHVGSVTGKKVTRTPSAAAAAADAAAAIAEASRAAASIGRQYHTRHRKQYRQLSSTPKIDRFPVDSSPLAGSPYTTPKGSYPPTPPRGGSASRKQAEHRQSDGLAPHSGAVTPTTPHRPGAMDSPRLSDVESGSKSLNLTSDFVDELCDGYDSMDEDFSTTKKMLIQLQELLLNGRVDDDEVPEECSSLEGGNSQDQLTIINARLEQRNAAYDNLKSELNKYREECVNLQGVKAGLNSRMSQQEQTIMQMKTQLLKLDFVQQNSDTELVELHQCLKERDREISALRSELIRRDRTVEKQRAELEDTMRRIDEMGYAQAYNEADDQLVMDLQCKIQELQEKLENVGTSEADISARISSQDKKMATLEDRILNSPATVTCVKPKPEEMDVIREGLESIRGCFRSQDPHHHTLDTLEQCITSMLERLVSSPGEQQNLNGFNSNDSTESYDLNQSTRKILDYHRTIPRDSSGATTKVLYFTERTVTPFLTQISKRLGNITLGDFKEVFDRPGPFRFHFKALDPEFGTVKEEIIDDDAIVPGWEGKIVAWVEEDVGIKSVGHQDMG